MKSYERRLAEAAQEWRDADKARKQHDAAERIVELEGKELDRLASEAYQRLYNLMADVAGEAGARAVEQYGEALGRLADQ